MKITAVEYLISAVKTRDYPKEIRREVAFVGRSNVGKSSLINALLKRGTVAKVSGTPGKTRCINFFLVNGSFYFVDLPGYGFAKVSRDEQRHWDTMIQEYLKDSNRPKLVVLLVDIRHAPSPLDLAMQEWLRFYQVPFMVVATKADKLSANGKAKSLAVLRKAYPGVPLLAFSSPEETGRLELWGAIRDFVLDTAREETSST